MNFPQSLPTPMYNDYQCTTTLPQHCQDMSADHDDHLMITWCRRQSAARKTVSFVQSDLEQVVSQSPFLQSALTTDTSESIALFHRSEIITGARLGRGGFSDVYEVVAFELNEHISRRLSPQQLQTRLYYQHVVATGQASFALKHLKEDSLNDQKAFQVAASDLCVEAAYLSSLDHPNILKARGLPVDGVEALGDGRHDGYFIILDRLEGTLDQCVEQWKQPGQDVSVVEKADYALQLARAIEYLHEHRLVFRDLKPANIGFSADGTIKLLDFGLCRQLPAGHAYSQQVYRLSGVGTRRYMAPEVITSARYNQKVDVFSWALLFWEMLSLEKPFATLSLEDHRIMVCDNGLRPRVDAKLPRSIQNLLQQTWCESIPQRLSISQAVAVLSNIINSLCMVLQVPASPVDVCGDDASLRAMMMMEQEQVQQAEAYKMLQLPMLMSPPPLVHQQAPSPAHLTLPSVSASTTHDFLKDHRMSATLKDMTANTSTEDLCSLLLEDSSLLMLDDNDMTSTHHPCPEDLQVFSMDDNDAACHSSMPNLPSFNDSTFNPPRLERCCSF